MGPPSRALILVAAVLATGCTSEFRQRRIRDTSYRHHDTGPELCDGVDNDSDGEIDGGPMDLDDDGVGDCYECSVAELPAEPVAAAPCDVGAPPPAAPWDLEEAWSFTPSNGQGCRVTSAADLDGDGMSEVLCAGRAALIVLSGDDGSIAWRSTAFDSWSPVAVADVDGDGAIDVVGIGPDGHLVALEADGAAKWETTQDYGSFAGGTDDSLMSLHVADLDADGTPEVLTSRGVVSGADGARIRGLDLESAYHGGWIPADLAVADLDRDGVQDVLTDWRRFEDNRTEAELPTEGAVCAMPLVVQADGDDDGEMVWSSELGLTVADPDGTVLASVAITDGTGACSYPCAGDLDGDGAMEIIVAELDEVRAYSAGLDLLWTLPIGRNDLAAACTVADLDGDGDGEVLLAETARFLIADGDGAVRFEAPRSASSLGDLPLVVDLDGDGSVEVVVPNALPPDDGSGSPALVVYRNVNRDWPAGAAIWADATWSGTAALPDGSVPPSPLAPWLVHDLWRGQPDPLVYGVDLRAEVVEGCVAPSEEEVAQVRLAVRIVNEGPGTAPAGTPLALYRVAQDGSRVAIGSLALTEDLPAATASPTFEVVSSRYQASRGIVVVAGDDGSGAIPPDDCDPADNTAEWTP